MLLEFSVSNFKSIKEQVTFSMIGSKPHLKNRAVHETLFNQAPSVIEAASIFGPNGSGKTKFIEALEFFHEFVLTSHKDLQRNEKIYYSPFEFSKKTKAAPSEFEIVFICKNHLFRYGFSVDSDRVHNEWLYAVLENGKRQTVQKWFERDVDDYLNKSFIRSELEGSKKTWLSNTRANALFLSTAVANNSVDFSIPFDWITNSLVVCKGKIHPDYSINQFRSDTNFKERILKFMKSMDVSFDDLKFVDKALDVQALPEGMSAELKKKILENNPKVTDVYSVYKVGRTSHSLDFNNESDGTKRLFEFSAPILDVLENGYTLIVDELDKSLHPIALESVVSLFQNKKINKYGAQLIFTTHSTNIMKHMDKEQIWLIEKNKKLESELRSIADFNGRAEDAVEKRYLSGRYGALPNIADSFEFFGQ